MELSAQAIIENLVEHHAQVEAQLRYQIVRQQVHIAALEAAHAADGATTEG